MCIVRIVRRRGRLGLPAAAGLVSWACVAGAGAQGVNDALLAVESNRANIVSAVVERFGAQLERLGFSGEALRVQLMGLRADQLLAASLVRDLGALELARPAGAEPLQQFVAAVPRPLREAAEVPEALAYVARLDGALKVLGPAELAARRTAADAGDQVVGWFVDGALLKRVMLVLGEPARDGSGTTTSSTESKGSTPAAGNWLGYTGGGNTVSGVASGVVAGTNNAAVAAGAAVVAGERNRAEGARAMVGAGWGNLATGDLSVVAGGGRDSGAEAAGGNPQDNVAFGKWTFVGGGRGNRAGVSGSGNGNFAAVVGGQFNTASGFGSLVGGGASNTASSAESFVGAGVSNTASGVNSVVGGGDSNAASGIKSAVGGGESNTASTFLSFVGGGSSNTASGNSSLVGGGFNNTASGQVSFVGGGGTNVASGVGSTVPGGFFNVAAGDYSVAMGRRAKARQIVGIPTPSPHHGAFVFADSTDADFHSNGDNTFNVRSTGGARFITNSGAPSTGVTLAAGGGSWSSLSDVHAKTDFGAVDPERVLAGVLAMPIVTWRYHAEDESVRHMGPVAQEFRRSFGLGYDDRTITTVDADGVAFAAIQGLSARLEAENAALRRELAALRAELRALSVRTHVAR